MSTHFPDHEFEARRGADAPGMPPHQTGGRLRVVKSDQLFHGDNEIGIDHGGALYRLKITRQGKLILNK